MAKNVWGFLELEKFGESAKPGATERVGDHHHKSHLESFLNVNKFSLILSANTMMIMMRKESCKLL